MVVTENLPFKFAEADSVHAFINYLNYLNPYADSVLPMTGMLVRRDLTAAIRLRLPGIKKAIARAQSKIHLIYDGWTSDNRMSLLGVQARFLDSNLQLQSILLGLPKLIESHTGLHMAETAFKMTEKYGFTDQLGFTMADGAGNNNTMAEEMDKMFAAAGLRWDHVFHRCRCLGHIIHRAAGDFFFKAAPPPHDDAAWRQFGCYGKLHNIVIWVQSSTERVERWHQLSSLVLLRDNSTRWHSYYDMCARALLLKWPLIQLLQTEPGLSKNHLSPEDWGYLENLTKFLEPFRDATKSNEGVEDSIDRILPSMEFLISHLEGAMDEYRGNPFMEDRVQATWEKLHIYYKLTDDTIVYAAATVLNPILKWRWFESQWDTPELRVYLLTTLARIKQLWLTDYAEQSAEPARPPTPQTIRQPTFSSFLHASSRLTQRAPARDELQTYLSEQTLSFDTEQESDNFRALTWWTEQTQRTRFPRLSKMAFDILTVPTMSAEMERIFSECALALNHQRLSITQETLEQLVCLRSWLRNEKRNMPHIVGPNCLLTSIAN